MLFLTILQVRWYFISTDHRFPIYKLKIKLLVYYIRREELMKSFTKVCNYFCQHLQNHRIVEVERDFWRTSGPCKLLLKLLAFESLQGGRFHRLSGKPVPVLGHFHSWKLFSHVQMEFHVFVICTSCLLLCQWALLEDGEDEEDSIFSYQVLVCFEPSPD